MNISNSVLWEALAVLLYFCVVIFVGVRSYKKQTSDTDFIIGNRSMGFLLTALAAHASDMSSWLFMGYPAQIFGVGLDQVWTGIGLLIFMYLNWELIAPKVRIATEQYNSLTFSSFFENRLADTSGVIRVFTAIMLFIFYTIYISAALVGMGIVIETLFGLDYHIGVIAGILIVIPYVFIGGYLTLANIDLFQGLFLLVVIIFVPLYALSGIGGFSEISQAIETQKLSGSLFPSLSFKGILSSFFLMIGWGLGYFGQPHIITKFMGIRNVSDIKKSKRVGMSWMLLALSAATLVGLVGIAFFPSGLKSNSEVFVEMVRQSFPPFLVGFILCAVFAAAINAISSMVLVLSSSLSEDIYKKLIHKTATPKELLFATRMSVIFVSLIAFLIAIAKVDTIYGLVEYAWSGLGASFGPLLLLCLYYKKTNKYGAWTGIILGGGVAAVWPLFAKFFPIKISSLPPAFVLSILSIWLISKWTSKKTILSEND